MKLILGLDAGSSSTKLMAMTEDGKKFIVPMRMGPMGDHKTFGAALSRFAADNALTEEDFAYVAVTGGRAAEAGDRILDVPCAGSTRSRPWPPARCASAPRKRA